MILQMYSIFDSAAAAYLRPFYCQTDGEALRAFTDIATDADHNIGKHPEDYSLYRVGQFDDNKGKLVPLDKECLATAQEVVASSRKVTPMQGVS